MIDSHEKGIEKYNILKKIYDLELELHCLNSSFYSIDKINHLLEIYKNIKLNLSNNTILKESEFHTKETPYYEMSVFCNINEAISLIENNSLKNHIDLIHLDGDNIELSDLIKD